MISSHITLITGARRVGKSTLCKQWATDLRAANIQVSGLLTRHTGLHDLEVEVLRSGARYRLTQSFVAQAGQPLARFQMDAAASNRSRQDLADSVPTDILIVDELGPLEFIHNRGWVNAFSILAGGEYQHALIVVRLELLAQAVTRLGNSQYTVVHVTVENRNALRAFAEELL